jgi:putative SOS response-associated peptidase YedK
MCGRYNLQGSWSDLVRLYRIVEDVTPLNLRPRYNIAPTQDVVVVRKGPDGKGRDLSMMRWGLVPSWAKDVAIGARLINARAETVAEKPSFRDAYRRRRCLIPADGFYEWQKRSGGAKQPYLITLEDQQPIAFAGLWERWDKASDGGPVHTCAIITTEANDLLRPIHGRMPVILDAANHDAWLNADGDEVTSLLRPYPSDGMRAGPVGAYVNRAANDDPKCLEPGEVGGAERLLL